MQSESKLTEKRDKSQNPTCKIIEQQSRLSDKMDLESSSQANVNTQWKVSEPSRVISSYNDATACG